MQKVCYLALAVIGVSFSLIAQEQPINANRTKTAAAPAAPQSAASADRNIRFQFDGIAYMDVVERFAQMAGKPLIAETNVQGTVTFNDPRPYDYAQALETLNTMLSMKNVMLVETERFLQLVPYKDLPQMPLKIFRGLDQTGDVRGGEVVTVVLELKNLDAAEVAKATSSMLSNAGSVAPLSRGNGLILTDRMENIRRVKQLLAEIDTKSPIERTMRTHTLLHASGAVVADLINKTFGAATAPKNRVFNDQKKQWEVLPPEPETYVTAVFDDASKTLLLFGPAERVTMAEDLIRKFEEKDGGRGGEVRIFTPQATKAEDLARMIREAIPGVASERESGSAAATKARVIVDAPKNRLIVTAPVAGQLDAIENLVNRVESGTSGTLAQPRSERVEITKVVRLQVADPQTAFRVITNAFTRRGLTGEQAPGLKANLDAQTKTIVITGSPGDVQHALGIIEQMENIDPASGPMETTFLEFASATELKRAQPLIQQLYSNQVSDGTPGAVPHAKFLPDPDSKRLIVSASKKHLELIHKIAEQVRAPSIATQPREFRAMVLKNVKVDQIHKTISDLVAERMNDDAFRDVPKPLLLPDSSNNRLLITANAAQLKEIDEIVRTIDVTPAAAGDRQFRSVKLYNRAPAEVATLAEQLYKEQLKGQPDPAGGSASFVPETKGNRVIVIGPEKETARAEALIRQIDPEIVRTEKDETRVLRLRNAVAQDLAGLVEKSLNLEDAKVKLLIDPRSNSIVISGSSAGVESAARMIEQLDILPNTQPKEVRMIELKSAEPASVVPMLTQLLADVMRNSRGSNYVVQSRIVADPNANRVIVTGTSEELAEVSSLVQRLDTPPKQSDGTRVFAISSMKASDMARIVSDAMVTYRGGGGRRSRVQVSPDDRSNNLVVTGDRQDLQDVAAIIEKLDGPEQQRSTREVKIVELQTDEPAKLVSVAQQVWNAQTQGRPGLNEVTLTLEPSGRRLIIVAPSNLMRQAEQMVTGLDVKPDGAARSLEVVELKQAAAATLLPVVTRLYEEQQKGKNGRPATILPEASGKRLMIYGSPEQVAAIREIVSKLEDGARPDERETRVYNLNSTTADELVTMVRSVYQQEIKKRPEITNPQALILPDSLSNRLIVSGSVDELNIIEGIIQKLDQVSEQTGNTRTFQLKNARADQVATLLSTTLVRFIPNANRTVPRVTVGIDANNNTIIVSGQPADLAAASTIVEKLDDGTNRKERQMRILALKSGKATELANKVRTLYLDQVTNQPSLGPADALILGDTTTDRLVLAASEPQLELLQKIVSELDEAGANDARQISVRPLKSSSARSIAAVLQQFFARNIASQEPTQKLLLSASPDDRALILEGSDEILKKVNELTGTLEERFEQDNIVIQTVRLQKALAENVAEAVNQTLAARGPAAGPNRAKITPVSNSNALLIDGPAESVQDVIKVIKELDAESTGGDVEIRVYKLEHGKAREMSQLLDRMLQSVLRETARRTRGQGQTRLPSVVISADERTNSLIVSANPDQFKTIEQLLLTLDQNSAKTDRSVRFVILKNARAFEVSTRLNLLFDGRPREERPVIEADTFGNSLTVIGSKADIAEIERVVAELDQVSREESIQVRMLVIDNLPAAQIAKMLQSLYSQMSQVEIQVVDRLQPPPPGQTNQPAKTEGGKTIVTLSVDRTANALLMSGPSHELDAINNLVNELTFSSLGNESEFRQFSLKEADPVAVARTLVELFKPEPVRVQQGGQPQMVTPAPRMTIVAEPRTRSIIVRGKATDFILLESLLEQLDVKSPSAQLAYRLIKLEHAEPQKVLPLVQQMITQLGLAKPGDPVSVTLDLRTRSIFAVARETMLSEVEQIVKGLDTPPAYPEAEVAMIALRNTVAAQLATVLQNMIRSGPAGDGTSTSLRRELLEQVRSLRIKNEDGREVVLDLERPIRIMADSTPGTRGGNRLLISSTPDNVKALSAIVEMMDTVALVEGVSFRIVRLEHADAQTVASTLTQIFAQGQRLSAGPAGPAEPASETGRALTQPLNVATDQRSNTLILSGKSETLDLAQRLIRDLDAEAKGFITEVRLFRLNYASAVRLAPLLQTVFTEAGPVPGTEGLNMHVTRLQTLMSTNNLDGKTSLQPKIRSALTIQADDPSNTLVVAARADIMPLIDDVIKTMDVPGASGMDGLRIFPLKNADATRLRQIINEIYTARGALMRPEDKPVISVDTRTNSLLVSGNERIYSFIETLVGQLDKDLPFEFGEFRVIKLENADAGVVAQTLQQIIDTRAQQKAALTAQSQVTLRAIIIGDPRINSIIVGGASEVFELVEALAKQLDQPGLSLSGQIRLIPLEHANAGTLSGTLNLLFSQRYSGLRDANAQRNRPIILPDPRINALLVSAGVEDNKALEELLEKLDRKLEDPALSIEIIGLKENDAARVADMIQTVFAGRIQAMTLPGQTPNPQDRVVISSDPLSNALIIVANKENQEIIRGLIEKVDVQPNLEGGLLQIITLKKADAGRVAAMLRNLVSQGLYRPGVTANRGPNARGREAMAIAVDTRSNTLIVSASPENLAVIKEVIERIDSEDYSLEGDIRIFTLRHARASLLAQTLQQFFNAKRTGESQGQETGRRLPVTIMPDDRTNTILVTGGKEAFEAVERLIAQLDSADVFDKMNFRVVTLKNSTASKLQGTLTRLFSNRPPRTPGRASDPITIVADQWANALVIGASVEDMDMVLNLIETIDTTQPENGMQVAVIPVIKGDATGIAQTIRSLYREGPNAPVTVQVDVDERLNAIVVSAGEADLKRIQELVEKLDTSNVARVSEIRIFPLHYAQADELAQTLTIAFTGRVIDPSGTTTNPQRQSMLQFITRTPEGEELVASALKESLLITADRRRNALVISAPVDSMNLLSKVIQTLDSESPQLARIRVFKLTNADARQMADVLTTLFRLRQQPGVPPNQRAIQYTLVRDAQPGEVASGEPYTATIGSAEQFALTVTIDLRTNSLLLGGTDHYVGLAAHIIEELDSSPALERMTEVYRLKNAQAKEVELVLRSFVDQERQRVTLVQGETLGTGTAPASAQAVGSALAGETVQQLLEKEVAIVAETNSNTLLISASPRYFPRFKQIIAELDEPLAQVLIQVILAEVTLNKASDLGVEWTLKGQTGSADLKTGTDFGVVNDITQFGGFSSTITGSDVTFVLRALESDGRLEVLSRPQILTADNQKATINIGQRVPLVTDTRVSGENLNTVTTYKYEDVGVSLAVTPRISPDGTVKMEVEPMISQLSSTEVQLARDLRTPVINQRKATTTVSVRDGESVIIGGLIATTDERRRDKVPILGNIPYLGVLFRSSHALSDRKELLIILTPQLLLDKRDSATISGLSDGQRITRDQLQRSTIKDEIRRDKLQQEILEPILPLFDKQLPPGTNSLVKPPKT
jgi:type II secretion system protein D